MDTVFGDRMLITRGDIARTRRDHVEPRPLEDGEALFRVRRVALTANNVTYAAAGESLGYWRFFPGPAGEGALPVWGFADVVDSRADGLTPGDRFYGYWPLATHLIVQAHGAGKGGFSDAFPHRQGLSDFYNRYQRAAGSPTEAEAMEALFRPLFMTGWLIDRFLAREGDFGARQVILSSASSKTAMSAAFCLSRREGDRPRVVGLTSHGNRAFVTGLGCYDEVVTYDAVAALRTDPAVFVDFAGDRDLTARVHRQLGDALRHSAIVGMTHWGAGGDTALPGPTPQLFFAPSVAEAMLAEMGPDGFAEASGAAFTVFLPFAGRQLTIDTRHGLEEAEVAYRALASGEVGGAQAIVIEL